MRKLFLVQVLAYVLFSAIATAQTQDAQPTDLIEKYVQGEVIVRFDENIRPTLTQADKKISFGVPRFDAAARQFNCVEARRINATKRSSNTNYTYVIRYTATDDPKVVMKALMATGVLKYAEPDYYASTGSTTPNDGLFNLQWSLYNTSTPGADISMRQAWDITQGSSAITVAVIDCGLKLDHPDFVGRVWTNTAEIAGNGIDDDGNGYVDDNTGWNFVSGNNYPSDDNGHGCSVSGILGANGNNTIGIAGIDWNCKIMVLKSFNSSGSGTVEAIISAINYATDNGARAMNMSFVSYATSALQDAVDLAYAENITMVAAMGNYNNSTAYYPAAYSHVIAVGATTNIDRRASFSNYGSHICLVAPGNEIFSPMNSDMIYAAYSGTSQATPHVTGVVSLLLAQNCSRTPDQIKAILQATSDDHVGLASEDVVGWDQYYGWGRLNAYRALTYAPPAGMISGASQVCVSATTTLTDTATGGTWSSSNTSVATVNSSGVVTGIAQGTVTISYNKTYGCGTSRAVKQIQVNLPPAAISGSSMLCTGNSVTLGNTSGGGTWTTSNASVATVGSATGVAFGVTTGTATIGYSTGCGADVAKTVTVNLTPSSISGSASICLGISATLSNTTSGGTWNSSNASVATVGSTTGIVTGMALGTANINYVVSSGCQATLQVSVVSPSAITLAYVPTTNLLAWYPFNGNANNSLGNGKNGTVNGATLTTDRFGTPNSAYYFDGDSSDITIDTAFFNIGWANYTISCWINSDVVNNPYNGNRNESIVNTSPHRGLELYYNWGLTGKYGILAGSNPDVYSWNILSLRPSSEPIVSHTWKHIAMVKTGGLNYRFYIDGVLDTVHTSTVGASTYYTKMVLGNLAQGVGREGFYGKLDDYGFWNRSLSDAEVYRLYTGAPSAAILCLGGTLPLTHPTPGGTWSSSNTSVATVGTGDGIVAAVSVGTSVISYVANGCTSTIVVTVNAPGVAAITGTASMFVGAATTLSDATPGGTWSSTNPSIAAVGSATGIVSGVSAGMTTITYGVTGGCGASYKVVTVNAAASLGPITGASSVCIGNTTTFSNATSGGTWSSSNTSVATVGSASGIVSGVTIGSATITYSALVGGSTMTATKVISVTSTPSVSITGSGAVCIGAMATLGTTLPGGTWSSNYPSIAAIGSSSGIVTGVSSGVALISYTVTVSCGTASASKLVTVNAGPSVSITGTGTVCTGATTILGNNLPGGTWSSSNTSVATVNSSTGAVSGVSSGNATITYTVSASCGTATATKVVTVSVTPPISGSLALCTGMTSTLSGGATGGTWSTSNASVATIGATTGVLTGVSTGTATITYAVGSSCIATAVASVSQPASIAGTSNVCVGLTTTLTDATAGGTWSCSNTSLATVDETTGEVAGVAAGTVTISYVVSATCYRTIAFTVKANPPGVATPVTVCEGSSINIPPPSSNGYSWTSSNTSVATIGSSSGVLTGVVAGTTILTYTTITGCYITTEATVNAMPSITGTTALCAGGISSLSCAATGGTWNSSNNSVATVGSATGVVTAVTAGNATISYTTSGCRATALVSVSPLAPITGILTTCIGTTTTLADATTGGTWSSSDPAIAAIGSATGVVIGVGGGNAIITYTIASGCARTTIVTVMASPGTISGSLSICPGSTSTLTGATPGGTWSGGNATIATINSSTGVVSGIGAGNINVSYTLSGCRTIAVFTVNPLPAPITGTVNACVGQNSTLTDATTGGAWSSNNTSIATVDASTGIVTGVSAATTLMTYTLATGCYKTVSFTVKALPPAIASPVAACVGTTTSILPPSTNGKSWSSSNTAVATIGSSNGILTGVATGTTTLTYTTTTGCFVTTEATVYALPSAGAITGPASVVVGSTITLDNAAGGGVWSSSNTARATVDAATGIVTGVAGGTAAISYSVSNPGCTVRTTQLVSVVTSRPGDGQSAVGSFQLYPNPTTGAFTVEVEEGGTFTIFSLDGREVSKHNIKSGINQLTLVNQLANGIYMCRYTSENGNTTMVRLIYER